MRRPVGISQSFAEPRPGGAVLKLSGKELALHAGPARVFDREEDALTAILGGKDTKGRRDRDPVRGAKGGPGCGRCFPLRPR